MKLPRPAKTNETIRREVSPRVLQTSGAHEQRRAECAEHEAIRSSSRVLQEDKQVCVDVGVDKILFGASQLHQESQSGQHTCVHEFNPA